jgi:hypothetical protein
MKYLIIIGMLLVTIPPVLSKDQEQGWHGIIPLITTRADVEAMLGPPVKENSSIYETGQETVSIVYSDFPCKEGLAGAWNVSRDTVIRIRVTPKKTLRLSDLKMESGKYQKIEHPHIDGMLSYIDEDSGVTINTRYETVEEIFYNPQAKDKKLNCSSNNPDK